MSVVKRKVLMVGIFQTEQCMLTQKRVDDLSGVKLGQTEDLKRTKRSLSSTDPQAV
jgi:hypothetical protein